MHKCKCGNEWIPATRVVCEECEKENDDWYRKFFEPSLPTIGELDKEDK